MNAVKTSGYASVNGISMYYEIHGTGTIPLVLIHGGGSTIDTTFGNILPLLAAHGKVIAVELQAHGRTSDRNAPESFEQDADDVAALLAHLGIAKANILGFSNGGTTTLQLALRHQHMVNKMIVLSANYSRDGMMPGFFDGMQHATIDHMPAVLKDAFLKVTPDERRLQTMFEKDRDRMLHFKDIPDVALQSIQTPALLMAADKDVMTVEHAVTMYRLLPAAQLVVLPGTHGSAIGAAESGVGEDHSQVKMVATLVQEFINS